MDDLEKTWLLWQLLDSAFPGGGFAHSSGLEAAWQWGLARNREELADYLRTSLVQAARSQMPFVAAAHGRSGDFQALDQRCDALLTSHVANRASRAQGNALILAAQRIFRIDQLSGLRALIRDQHLSGHFAPVFGTMTSILGLRALSARSAFMFLTLRGLVTAGVRLGIVGPLDGQAIQHQLSPLARAAVERYAGIEVEEAAQTAPITELVGMTHDRLYSRLFQS